MCQPGRPIPHGDSHAASSPGFCAFQRAKSRWSSFSSLGSCAIISSSCAPEDVSVPAAKETLVRFRELAGDGLDAKGIVRELKAVGGDLRSLRLALTGKERGPELWAVIAALPREEALRRAERALSAA